MKENSQNTKCNKTLCGTQYKLIRLDDYNKIKSVHLYEKISQIHSFTYYTRAHVLFDYNTSKIQSYPNYSHAFAQKPVI